MLRKNKLKTKLDLNCKWIEFQGILHGLKITPSRLKELSSKETQ